MPQFEKRKVEARDHFTWHVETYGPKPKPPKGFVWERLGRRLDKTAPDGKGWDIWWLEKDMKQVIMCDDPQMLKAATETVHENGPVKSPVSAETAEKPCLTTDANARKNTPIFSGCLRYFPRALAAVAALSQIGNEQHNPGTELHWDRTKSADEWDSLARHLLEVGTYDTDGVRHSAKVCWRALAGLEKELEQADGNGS